MAMCTSRKESGPPMVAILQGLSANVQYAILIQNFLLPPLQATYLEKKTENHKSKETISCAINKVLCG